MIELRSVIFLIIFFVAIKIRKIVSIPQVNDEVIDRVMMKNGIISGSTSSDGSWNMMANIDQFLTNHSNDTTTMTEEEFANIVQSQKIGLFMFTQYCGPGDRVWKNLRPNNRNMQMYRDIDACCKKHDECPNWTEGPADHNKYPGLSIKPQMFARLQCNCDGGFYKCLNDLQLTYANLVAIGYGMVQHYCFQYEHPIVSCTKYTSRYFMMRRCEEYIVDPTKPKIWQWFDLPPANKKIFDFPRIQPN